VKIYGEDWKRHYNLSTRETNGPSSNSNFQRSYISSDEGVALSARMRNDSKIRKPDYHTIGFRETSGYNIQKPTMEYSEDSSDNLESPSLISCLPHLSEDMAALSLNREVKSYIELYNDEPKTRRGTVLEDQSFPLKWNNSSCKQAKSVHKSSMSDSMERLRDVQDDWKNCDPYTLDINWKMDGKPSISGTENVDPCQQYTPKSLTHYNNCEDNRRFLGNKLQN